jgi:AcrR family transcriptional regulator
MKKLPPAKNDPFQSQNSLIRSSAKDAELIEVRHRTIIDGACKLFFRKGYHGTTIREIAEASGMSMGQLYHYISSKDDVLFLIYKHMQTIWFEHLRESGVEEIGDALQRLTEALEQTLVFMMENKELLLFIYTETKYLDPQRLHAVLEMDNSSIVSFWRRLVGEAGGEAIAEGDLNFYANLISYLMVFLVLRGWNLKDKPLREHGKTLIAFILKGLGVTHNI